LLVYLSGKIPMPDNIIIPERIYDLVKETHGAYFSGISKISAEKITRDFLSPAKPHEQLDILKTFLPNQSLQGKKLLEIGSGYGIFVVVTRKLYQMDAWGVEPSSDGFDDSLSISRKILQENDIETDCIFDARGENLPFEDNTFDIVYSTNVLEHVENPLKVIDEALRVLKPGGILQIVYPNYLSYFDGHYAVFHPPVIHNKLFAWYLKNIRKRDPAFALTIRTELNPLWTTQALKQLKYKYAFELLSLGQEVFVNRFQTLDFSTWSGLTKVKSLLQVFNKLKLNILAAKVIVWLKGWTPVILTLKKTA
jgi:ubiquinone/menaquinone biosynthesis C-methylase UbiE